MRPPLPKLPTKVMEMWCSAHYREEVLGDLEEEFYKSIELHGLSQSQEKLLVDSD